MRSSTFDPAAPLAQGVTALEASAGTGKTHTITGLVTRCVADGVRLPRLLVVTFTRAATSELRERVRTRLLAAADHLGRVLDEGSHATDDEVLAAIAAARTDEIALRRDRLVDALSEFDAATISTIHGFCQQVLAAIGLAADVDREAVLVEDERTLVEATADDLFLRTFHRDGQRHDLKRADVLAIAQKVIDNPDARLVPAAADDPGVRQRVLLARQLAGEVDRRKRLSGFLSYGDLLTRLLDTLRDPLLGEAAGRRLRAQYQVALIDEFQDTDPTQWEILSRLFGTGESRLALIGDPKQAIYSFRGADVYAYLDAASGRDARTLGVNWRSDQGLCGAYNVLFNGATLGHPGIRYRPVEAPPAHAQARLAGAPVPAPLRLRVVRRDAQVRLVSRGGKIQVDSARDHVARDLAAQIVALLESPARLLDRAPARAQHAEQRVRPHHLAVLVRANAEAVLVQRTLRNAGVPAVINGVGSVFATTAASDWLRLLEALEQPASPGRVRAAALTAFLGWTAETVVRADDREWDGLRERLYAWSGVLRARGVASLLGSIMRGEALPARVLGRVDGERLLTDLAHVGELLDHAAGADDLGLAALGVWLRERIREAHEDTNPEERARRLESDAEAVQVLTVHRSKGLEFPIVFCPYLWSGGRPDTRVPVYHDRAAQEQRSIDVGGKVAPHFEHHKRAAEFEQRGEDLRLLYVALTRARHQAVVWWAPGNASEKSPLARVLFSRDRDNRALTDEVPRELPGDDLTLQRLADLAAPADGGITVETTPPDPQPHRWAGAARSMAPLQAARFERGLDHRWRRTSYTALTRAHSEAHATPPWSGSVVGSEPDEPLDDDERLPAAGRGTAVQVPEPEHLRRPCPLDAMPGGTEVGTFVHAVLERTDFTAAELDAELDERIAEQQSRRQLELGASERVRAGLRAAIETPLGPEGRRLRDVARRDRLDELTFELPLPRNPFGASGAGAVTIPAIGRLMRAHLAPHDPLAGYADRLDDPALRGALRGYLTGSIDLVLRTRGRAGPQFFVVDYKTNRLAAANESLTAWHYRPAALAEAMQRGHYALQALLYTVALHRYLRWRLRPSYDPDRDLGGILYLFLRGMTGSEVPQVDGRPCGVFAWRPPAELVEAVSDLLEGGAP